MNTEGMNYTYLYFIFYKKLGIYENYLQIIV